MSNLNVFYNQYKSSELTLTGEKYATRLYLLLFISIFTILLLYNAFAQQGITVDVQQPTEAAYEHLAVSFASSLLCPFVQNRWIESVYGNGDWSTLT